MNKIRYMPNKWLLGALLLCCSLEMLPQYRYYSSGRLRSKNLNGKVRSAYIQCEDKDGNILFKAHNDNNMDSWWLSQDIDPITGHAAVAGYMRSSLTLADTTIKGFINRKNGVLMRWNDKGEIVSHYVLKTLRTSYFHRTSIDENNMYASGYARGHRRDQTSFKLPTNANTALLVAVDNNSKLLWYVNDRNSRYGATVIPDHTGEYLYWQGCSKKSGSNLYYTWIRKIRKIDGKVMWAIHNSDDYFLFDRSHHSEMSMSLDFRGNIIATQLNAVPFRNLVTGEVYYEKHLEVINYDIETRQEIFRTTVASADGLANGWTSTNTINVWDCKAFVDGTYHIVGTFKSGSIKIHQNDGTTYSQKARSVDGFHIKVNHLGELDYANFYVGKGPTFINYVGQSGNSIEIGGCFYRQLTIGDRTYEGYSDKAQIFSALVDDLPQTRLILPESENYEDGEILTDLVVYPNPVAEGGTIRFQNKLRAGVNYELKMIPVDQITYQATSIASFKLTQHDVTNGTMYVPLGHEFEEGMYYLMLYAEGELESTTRLVIE